MRVLNFIFPSTCLHCQERCEKLFCSACLHFLELINPKSRCPFCFLESVQFPCKACRKAKNFKISAASAFDYFGPIATLIKSLKYSNMSFLAEMAAPFLLLQFERLGWEMPDLIVPVPRVGLRSLVYGYNQSWLLGKALGKMLDVQVKDFLARSFLGSPQAGRTRLEREFSSEKFRLKAKESFSKKTILIIDDVMTTGSTINACASKLLEKEPKKLYALTLARTPLSDRQ